jgi:hypothetical protein
MSDNDLFPFESVPEGWKPRAILVQARPVGPVVEEDAPVETVADTSEAGMFSNQAVAEDDGDAGMVWDDEGEGPAGEDDSETLAFLREQGLSRSPETSADPFGLGGGSEMGGGGNWDAIAPVQAHASVVAGVETGPQGEVFPRDRSEGKRLRREPPALPAYNPADRDNTRRSAPRKGPEVHPLRTFRTDDPKRYPVPHGGRDGRYIAWDLDVQEIKVSVAWLADTGQDSDANKEREIAALFLVDEWERQWGESPTLADILHAWWRAAPQCTDVAKAAGLAGRSRNAAFGRLMGQNGMEFSEALRMSPRDYAKEMDAAHLPRVPVVDETGETI